MTNEKKSYRKHIAVGVVSLALAGGVAGTAFAASTVPGRGQHMTGTPGTGQGMGMGMGMGNRMGANQAMPVMTTAAAYLGLSVTDLQAQLHTGTSLTAIATAQGKSVTGLSDALTAAMTATINANTNLTAAQKAAMNAQVKTHVATMLTETNHQGATGTGQMRGHMGNGMGTGMGMGRGMRTA